MVGSGILGLAAVAAGLVSHATGADAKVYFEETFDNGMGKWKESQHKLEDGEYGKWEITSGKFFGNEADAKGLKTGQDAHFYSLYAPMAEDFSNEKKTLVIQFSVKNEQKIDCGGAYVKILPGSTDMDNFNGESQYNIMFGPDICGRTKRTHLIFNYQGKNLLKKNDIRTETDEKTHVYTMVLKPDNTYRVLIDGKEESSGSLYDEWDFLAPREIDDPTSVKPDDWDDRAMIDDPNDTKPEDWDTIPELVADKSAVKPDDWDDEDDGEWEPPQVPNPEFRGEWYPKRIENPSYKGLWKPAQVPNPDFKDDPNLYLYPSNKYIGFDLWQVKSGTIFDNILITDDEKLAEKFAKDHTLQYAEAEADALKILQRSQRGDDDEDSDDYDYDMGGHDEL